MKRRDFLKNVVILGGTVVAGTVAGGSILKFGKDNMKSRISIDKNKCIHCGLCVKDCMSKCISFDSDNYPIFNDEEGHCLGCQHCLAICPVGALSFDNKNPDKSQKVNYGKSEDLEGLIKSRRSIRFFKNENIDAERLAKIKEILPFVPTGRNIDDLHFTFVETKVKMDEIRKITEEKIGGSNIIYRTSTAMLVISVNKQKAAFTCDMVDPIIAMSYVDLYAQSLGLGTLWCGLAYNALQTVPEVYSMLKIPKEYTPSYVMLLGIPDVKYARTIQPDSVPISVIK